MFVLNYIKKGRILPFLFSLTLLLSILVAYHNILRSPFLFDDYNNILNNPSIKINSLDISSLSKVITDDQPTRNRPVAYLTFALNYYYGGDNPQGYNVVNVLIHICTTFFVFRLFFLYLLKLGHANNTSLIIAFVACFVWALNPIQTNAITYIVQRMTSLCTLFMSASLLMYFQARMLATAKRVEVNRLKITALSIMSFILWWAALMTKEVAAIMPLLLLLHEIFFFGGFSSRNIQKWKGLYLGVFLATAVIVIFHIGPGKLQHILTGYTIRDFTLQERLLTEARVVLHYMSLFLAPLPSRLTLYYDYQISRTLFSPPTTFFSIVSLSFLLAGAIYYARRFKLISFGILWTLICLIIESTIIPLEIIFEHRFYLPSIGFSLSLVYIAYTGVAKFKLSEKSVLLITVLALSVLVVLTYIRNETWKDNIVFSYDAAAKAPDSVRSHVALANAYLEAGYFESGKESLERAYSLDGTNIVVLANFYNLYTQFQAMDRASFFLNELKESILAGNFICTQANALDPLARILFTQKKFADAAFILETLTKCRVPAVVYQNLAVSYQELGRNKKAIEKFEKALQMRPDYPFYLYSLSYLYNQEGERKRAVAMLARLQEMQQTRQVQIYVRELETELGKGNQ